VSGKIVIVEDDVTKLETLIAFLSETYPDVGVEAFGSFTSALQGLRKTSCNLVLLDMTIPTFDRAAGNREGRLRSLGGYDIMRKLKLWGIDAPVVVVTQLQEFPDGANNLSFDEVSALCRRDFPIEFRGSVRFSLASSAWKIELGKVISEIMGG